MAVQAQYPSAAFKQAGNPISLEEFHHHHHHHHHHQGDNAGVNLFGAYNNTHYVGQQMLNGAVLSEQESELTCNMSGSRKRNRQDHFQLPPTHQQQMLLHHPLEISQHLMLPKVLEKTSASASISSGLQQQHSFDDNRLNGSGATSTSGRSSMISPFLASQDLDSNLLLQNLEIDALIQLQNEKLRSGLEETRKRHCRSLMSVLEQQFLKRLEEKETELANANRRNAELEEKMKKMNAENQIWFNVAKNNEAMANSLRSSLEQIILQNQNQNHGQQIREGFGDSCDGIADDAQSCCNQEEQDQDGNRASPSIALLRENHQLKQRKSCKVCHDNDISVLLLPCRHLCLCKHCDSKLDSCPICNSPKNASLQIFIP